MHDLLVDGRQPPARVLTKPVAVTPDNVDTYLADRSC
jgi:ABC-type sugar transport system substrate-binding protein